MGSLPSMTVVILEGKCFPAEFKGETINRQLVPGVSFPQVNLRMVKDGYCKGRLEVPTKYLLLAGLLLVAFGAYTRTAIVDSGER
jgi:hypothetical protein